MQQQLKEKDEEIQRGKQEIERGKREIDRCKREIESCKQSAAEAAAEAQNAHSAEMAQYLEKKSLDDFKRLVEKQRSWPWIRCFPHFLWLSRMVPTWSLGCSGHRSVMPWRLKMGLRMFVDFDATFELQWNYIIDVSPNVRIQSFWC